MAPQGEPDGGPEDGVVRDQPRQPCQLLFARLQGPLAGGHAVEHVLDQQAGALLGRALLALLQDAVTAGTRFPQWRTTAQDDTPAGITLPYGIDDLPASPRSFEKSSKGKSCDAEAQGGDKGEVGTRKAWAETGMHQKVARVPCDAPAVRVVTVRWATKEMAAKASPRKPSVLTRSRSWNVRSFDVAWRLQRSGRSETCTYHDRQHM